MDIVENTKSDSSEPESTGVEFSVLSEDEGIVWVGLNERSPVVM